MDVNSFYETYINAGPSDLASREQDDVGGDSAEFGDEAVEP